ncbi:MAG TPA: 4-(cytidine 5'-diphospho)-2-C-methyl-D-erythritol kinase [Clostridiales bacterium]|nr:4-(cytidine 5'-diphospho)-2-C-methyl-D-erythritol kinase [Clostridiales bacterium]
MDHIDIKARAKVNLALDVLGRRPDGYHNVRMVMQSIDLYDEVRVVSTDGDIRLYCDDKSLPLDENNLAYRAAMLLKERFNVRRGADIHIRKNIPVAAGLAGGSSDGAAVLKALNELWGIGLSGQKLMELGLALGADVPYCILGGTALAEGIGEVLTPLPDLPKTWMVLVKPEIDISTKWVYTHLDLDKLTDRPDIDAMVKAVEDRDIRAVAENLSNVLESVSARRYPVIEAIKNGLTGMGALGSVMSGSGPTVFGIFKDRAAAQRAARVLAMEYGHVYVTSTYNDRV